MVDVILIFKGGGWTRVRQTEDKGSQTVKRIFDAINDRANRAQVMFFGDGTVSAIHWMAADLSEVVGVHLEPVEAPAVWWAPWTWFRS